MSKIINGENLPNIPWQDKPKDWWLPIWRYSENPVIDRNPFPGMGRIFNSAVIPWQGKFKGVFRSEDAHARPFLYLGDSDDGIHWNFQTEKIHMHDPDGTPHDPYYAYDPRCVKIDDTYYIMWCGDFDGASIGVATTKDFKDYLGNINQKLKSYVKKMSLPYELSVSVGVLAVPPDTTESLTAEIDKVDEIMYLKKKEFHKDDPNY